MNARIMWVIALVLVAGVAAAGPQVGDPAPGFHLQDQNGDCHRLSDYEGKWLAIYFYPKDDTPGCTTEACNFRDNIYAFRRIGAEVVGISLDDVGSHKDFAEKYELPFTLLADTAGDTVRAYGVMHGTGRYARRESFLVDPEGNIAKHYPNVDPETHTEEVLMHLQKLMGEGGAD